MYSISYVLLEEKESWEQLSFDFEKNDDGWVTIFFPSKENDHKKVIQHFYNSIPKHNAKARLNGIYEKKGDTWQLIQTR